MGNKLCYVKNIFLQSRTQGVGVTSKNCHVGALSFVNRLCLPTSPVKFSIIHTQWELNSLRTKLAAQLELRTNRWTDYQFYPMIALKSSIEVFHNYASPFGVFIGWV